jgi:hypothetical protein
MATHAQRHHMLALMRLLLAHEPGIHYLQRRPMHLARYSEHELELMLAHGVPLAADCSETVTAICRLVGLHDPNGRHYDGFGNTTTMYNHLPHYHNPSLAGLGALCTFGPDGADHVVSVMTPGADPWCFSHGAEAGPRRVRWSVEKAIHRSPATFLSIADL